MVTIRPGELNQLLDLYAAVDNFDSPNAHGEEPAGEVLVAGEVWGAVDGLTGREVVQAAQVQPTATHKVVIRYREGITTRNWWRWESRRLDILHIRDVEGAGVKLEMLCQEHVTEPT